MILVLLADDEPISRNSVARLLRRRGFDVLDAATGNEVISILFANKDVDILVTDYTMPRGGVELLRRVKMMRPTLPVILLTGHDADSFDGYGYDLVLEKPAHENHLVSAIARILKR